MTGKLHENVPAYPLDWPVGWPRTKYRQQSRFTMGHSSWQQRSTSPSVEVGRRKLQLELARINATYIVLSTNMELRHDGQPRSDRRAPDDPGVAVYFALKGKPHVLACDKWVTVGENLVALAKHIEALRGQDRWGVGSLERAFAGFTALPPPGENTSGPARPWREVLNMKFIGDNLNADEREMALLLANKRYKDLMKAVHPDAADVDLADVGDAIELNVAIKQAREELGT